MIRSQLSRVILWNGALSAMPALTISRSIGPLAARASSKARSICVGVGDVALDRRCRRRAAATASSGSSRRPSSDSFAPAAWRCVCCRGADSGASAGDQRMAALEPVVPAIAPPFGRIGRTPLTVARRRAMKLAILETGRPPGDLADEFGDYPAMFGRAARRVRDRELRRRRPASCPIRTRTTPI